jgi:glyoxylate utilization-related uncharacterized protein
MELSERCIQILEKEGFSSVYEESYSAGSLCSERRYENRVSIFVSEGLFTLSILGQTHSLQAGDRFNIPANTPHSAVVGPQGCQLVVGEN